MKYGERDEYVKLSFYGAVREVTGSCHYLNACGKNIYIDCGMEQSADAKTPNAFPVSANQVDFVFLTHAHIDHSGRLPLLEKEGFSGKVYSTVSTFELCDIMLRDSAHIQESEAEWESRKALRAGKEAIEPLYTMQDAENLLTRFVPHEYGEIIEICEGIKIRFTDVGHLLGSACIEVWATEDGVTKKIAFSGDVGNINQPLVKDPSYIDEADYVVVESTYGNRVHNSPPDYTSALASVIQKTFDRGGNVIIPSFAVGRTQEVLYYIRQIKQRKMVNGHDDFPVYVDSPLAVEATSIYTKNRQDYDDEAKELLKKGINPIGFDSLRLSITSDDSKSINTTEGSKIIISAAGMCNAGRIKHHLKHNLWRKESAVVFVGYQANGTLGRILLDGAKSVKIFGEEIKVESEIIRLEGLSAHADKFGITAWLDAFGDTPQRIFIVHGSEDASLALKDELEGRYRATLTVPYYGEGYDLITDTLKDGRIIQETVDRHKEVKDSPAYRRLLSVSNRLIAVIMNSRNLSPKKLSKFTSQLEALVSKWDK